MGRHLLTDCRQDTVQIFENLIVPEADDPIAMGLDDLCSRRVDSLIVLATVELDREAQRTAGDNTLIRNNFIRTGRPD